MASVAGSGIGVCCNESAGYGWVAGPYPTGTFTPQEAPSLSRRDNDKHQPRA